MGEALDGCYAIAELRGMKMRPYLERALRHKAVLKTQFWYARSEITLRTAVALAGMRIGTFGLILEVKLRAGE